MNTTTLPSPRFERTANKTTVLHTSQWIPQPLNKVFDFFSRPENLQKLTPDHLQFNIVTPTPIEMRKGSTIDYKLKVHGIPIHWQSLISSYDPPHKFTDEQLKGPYKSWIHTHSFYEDGEGTRIEDHVTFQVPGGRLIEKLIVQKDLAAIFRHRHQVIEDVLQD